MDGELELHQHTAFVVAKAHLLAIINKSFVDTVSASLIIQVPVLE